MYEDLADAVETLKEKGFIHTFELDNDHIACRDLNVDYSPDDLRILESYRHERETDPGTDATVYAIQSISGMKGLMVIGYGKYADPEKARLIDMLLRSQKQTQSVP
ncbi:MAG: hypothetical protein WD016_04910 [Balneolaceae bacterium]